ncbi:hypothetical protein BC830DRAFT_1139389 [Chytriomyces sp. MP71]|nr:hypothetical protein BC830DRAFT_1139389 [Chytriomyces sp. MP71]
MAWHARHKISAVEPAEHGDRLLDFMKTPSTSTIKVVKGPIGRKQHQFEMLHLKLRRRAMHSQFL